MDVFFVLIPVFIVVFTCRTYFTLLNMDAYIAGKAADDIWPDDWTAVTADGGGCIGMMKIVVKP